MQFREYAMQAPKWPSDHPNLCLQLGKGEGISQNRKIVPASGLRVERKKTNGTKPLDTSTRSSFHSFSIHPLGQVVAGFQRRTDLCRRHDGVPGQVLGILPLEKFDAVLGVRLASEMAVGRGLLVL